MIKINKQIVFLIIITLVLFIIPFFWLKPGEMDLGGDSNRLYFYDPLSNLKAFAIYSVVPWGIGIIAYNQYYIPFLVLLVFLKSIFSSTILIAIFNGLKLSGSFIFIFLIIVQLLNIRLEKNISGKFLAAAIGALFYTFSPSFIDNMKYALTTHDQVFLYPMVFYFLLRYLVTSSFKHVWFALLVTFIFSTNFSFQAPPPLFAFFSLAIVFLLLYNFFILRKSIPWKGILIFTLFFAGLHAFHLIPVLSNVFDKGSEFNNRVFESKSQINVGLEYFSAILPRGKVSEHILLPLENPKLSWGLIIIPILVIFGFLSNHKKNKEFFLVNVFFFITLFLASANITQIVVEFYKKLFLIPGFGMFRNFFGQWQWVYTFFYSLLAGLSISYFFSRIRIKYIYLFSFLSIGFLVIRSWIVFNGEIVNVFNRGSINVPVVMRMDPNYEKVLDYIKKIPNDGRILHMPFTDFAYNIVGGANRGVYVGQSMVSLLAGKNDFAGYQNIDPFSELFVKLAREKNYQSIKQMMSLLQIRYVLYNSDEIISDKFFPTFPYGYTGVPASPSAALDFARNISEKIIYKTGDYSLFEVAKEQYLPNFYIAKEAFFYDTNPKYNKQYFKALSFFPTTKPYFNSDSRIVYMDRQTCSKILPKDICDNNNHKLGDENIQIVFQKINPTKYKIEIKNATKPFLLVFQSSFTPKWKLFESDETINPKDNGGSYYNGTIIELNPESGFVDKNSFQTNSLKSLYANTHIEVNGYANAWYINPQTMELKFIVEMTGQKIFYYSLTISLVTLAVFILFGLRIFRK